MKKRDFLIKLITKAEFALMGEDPEGERAKQCCKDIVKILMKELNENPP